MADHNAFARTKLDAFTEDRVCEMIGDGDSLTLIAKRAEVSIGSLLAWIEHNTERSARVREVRTMMAAYWVERAETEIRDSADEFELKKAKELAHHYRWKASKIAPRDYGDKLEVNNTGLPMVIVRDLTGRKDEPATDD